jgi:hypothetical protein
MYFREVSQPQFCTVLEQSQKLLAMLAMGLLALGSYSLWLVKEHIAIKN